MGELRHNKYVTFDPTNEENLSTSVAVTANLKASGKDHLNVHVLAEELNESSKHLVCGKLFSVFLSVFDPLDLVAHYTATR